MMQHKKGVYFAIPLVLPLTLTLAISISSYAEQVDTERLIRRITPPLSIVKEVPAKDEMYFDAYYEPSDVLQGSRTGHWSELTGTYGYSHQNIKGYTAISQYNRFDNKDYAAVAGAYFNMPDSYVHGEFGAGWYTDYIYRWQVIAEYGHKLIKDVYAQIGFNYRAYGETGDTYIAYPGLIYYFGDSYISANYGAIWIESRGVGSFGSFKGDFAITDFLHLWSGASVGQWLYDIYGLAPSKEFGYILSVGLNLRVYKGINARAGYSYSTEDPKFIKRSLSFGLSAKF